MVTIASRPQRSELLMPAGSLEKLKIAVLYGADAVYLGTPDMSLRTKSSFTLEEVVEGVKFAHVHGKRVYLTLNLFSHNKDIPKLPLFIETIKAIKPDGVIIADPGIFQYVKENAPELELHISTQANVCSWVSVDFWQKQGASLCVLAREVNYHELCEIREKCPNIKLEAFVHGAMCMTYSGRCLLSNFMAERGANQGNCANSCRWHYKVHMKLKDGTVKELNLSEENLELFEFLMEEECRQGELMPIEEDERGSYILNSKDLCLMPKLDDYLRIGVDSLKIEGRNKSAYYVAVTARAYRQAIDDWYQDPDRWSPKTYMEELSTVPSRGYTLAFHNGRLENHAHNYEHTKTFADYEYAGYIEKITDEGLHIAVKNRLQAGDVLELLPPNTMDATLIRLYEFIDAKSRQTHDVINAGQKPIILIPWSLFDQENTTSLQQTLCEQTIIRKEKSLTQAEWDRLKLDATAQRIELGIGSHTLYQRQRASLQDSIFEENGERIPKTPRIGTEGCCGRGCNGCAIFWHDPIYEKARALLAQKKQGEMFDRDMRSDTFTPIA
ncbi:U32 family peptidase [uncultured Kiloniella sp.]|uniref:U32 family peptidase n=1 Tax=uncultured Kiloniella sp. TaxID=1133091 RepID=UPI002622693C|nr:U32 family peptidase [uncultured Kiloniella sp.]